MTAVPETSRHIGWAETITVYLRPRVLIVMFLGLSSGLPLALSGSTLLVWMREAGVDLGTIGLFALVGTPYTIKFLWAPLVDALDVPVLSRLLGRRRGWLVFSQLLLMAATAFLAFTDPAKAPWLVAFGALMVATASATQDIVIDAFRVETLRPNEQAAGMASYRRGLSHRHAGLDRRRAVSRHRLRELGVGQGRGMDRRLPRDGGLRADRHRGDAARDRAGEIRRRQRGPRRACGGKSGPARHARCQRRVLGVPHPRDGDRRAACSWCSTNSATPSPER